MQEYTEGLHTDIPEAEYHKIDMASQSSIQKVGKNAAQYKYDKDHPEPPSKAQALGSAMHLHTLEPDKWEELYAVAPIGINRRTTVGKKEWAYFLKDNKDKVVVNWDDYNTCHQMRNSVISHPDAWRLLGNSRKELTAIWKHEGTGLMCKARIDILGSDFMADLKTTKDASPEGFSKAIYNYGYHIQAAFYIDALRATTGQVQPRYHFIAVEKTAPYQVAVYELDEAAIDIGRSEYERLMLIYAKHAEVDSWPGYNKKSQVISLPDWAMKEPDYKGTTGKTKGKFQIKF